MFEKAKTFVKQHKKAFIVGSIVVVATVGTALYFIYKPKTYKTPEAVLAEAEKLFVAGCEKAKEYQVTCLQEDFINGTPEYEEAMAMNLSEMLSSVMEETLC